MNELDVIRKTKERLLTVGWTPYNNIREICIDPSSPGCLINSLACAENDYGAARKVEDYLSELHPNLPWWNDEQTSVEPIIALLDKAAAHFAEEKIESEVMQEVSG